MPVAEYIDDKTIERHLSEIGMKIGDWHRIEYLSDEEQRGKAWFKIESPSDAKELLRFAQKILDWLPDSQEYIAAFDDSTHLDDFQLLILESTLGADLKKAAHVSGGIIIGSKSSNIEAQVRLSYFIFFCLLFGAHVYIAGIATYEGQILGILDEAAYFICKNKFAGQIEMFLKSLRNNDDKKSPAWVAQYSATKIEG